MIRQVFWMGVGAGLGLWGRRKTIDTVERYVPPKVANTVARSARTLGDELVKAQKRRLNRDRPINVDSSETTKAPKTTVTRDPA